MTNGHERINGTNGVAAPESLKEVTRRYSGGGILSPDGIKQAQRVLELDEAVENPEMSRNQATKLVDLYRALPYYERKLLDEKTHEITIDMGGNTYTRKLPEPDPDANLVYL